MAAPDGPDPRRPPLADSARARPEVSATAVPRASDPEGTGLLERTSTRDDPPRRRGRPPPRRDRDGHSERRHRRTVRQLAHRSWKRSARTHRSAHGRYLRRGAAPVPARFTGDPVALSLDRSVRRYPPSARSSRIARQRSTAGPLEYPHPSPPLRNRGLQELPGSALGADPHGTLEARDHSHLRRTRHRTGADRRQWNQPGRVIAAHSTQRDPR